MTVNITSTGDSGWVLGLWPMHTELTSRNTPLRSHAVQWRQIGPASDSRNIKFEVISKRTVHDSAYLVHVLSFSKTVAPLYRINDKLLNIVFPNISKYYDDCSKGEDKEGTSILRRTQREVRSENLKGRDHFENPGADGRVFRSTLNEHGLRCGIDSSCSQLGQVARPTELPDYPQNYVCNTFSKKILSDGVSSSVPKKVSSKRYTSDCLSNTYPTIYYHSRSWMEENFDVDLISTKFRPSLFSSERKHAEKQNCMNDLPPRGFGSAIKSHKRF
jgi:hypothetical protein